MIYHKRCLLLTEPRMTVEFYTSFVENQDFIIIIVCILYHNHSDQQSEEFSVSFRFSLSF
jgi:hypothetical protein